MLAIGLASKFVIGPLMRLTSHCHDINQDVNVTGDADGDADIDTDVDFDLHLIALILRPGQEPAPTPRVVSSPNAQLPRCQSAQFNLSPQPTQRQLRQTGKLKIVCYMFRYHIH